MPLSFALLHSLSQNGFKERKTNLIKFQKMCNNRSYFALFSVLVVGQWCKLCRLLGRRLNWGCLSGKWGCCWYVHTLYWMWIVLFSSGRFQHRCCVTMVALLEKTLSCFSGLVSYGDWGLCNEIMSVCHFYFLVAPSCPPENFVAFRSYHKKIIETVKKIIFYKSISLTNY